MDVVEEPPTDEAYATLEQDAEPEAEPTTDTLEVATPDPTKSTLRSGRWFPEEEAYASLLITTFKSGLLPLPEKMSLREFLSKIFHCTPMRITKKFEGNNMIGKISFRKRGVLTGAALWELRESERKFWGRMVKSKSPSALVAYAKMMEYSEHVFGNLSIEEDLNAAAGSVADASVSEHWMTVAHRRCQDMYVQLQQMIQPHYNQLVLKKRKLEHNQSMVSDNVLTVEKMLSNCKVRLRDLEGLSEDFDKLGDLESLSVYDFYRSEEIKLLTDSAIALG